MKRLLILAASISPIMLLGCNKNKQLTKEEFFAEYQKRLDKFNELGEIYKSVETNPDDYFSSYDKKIPIKSNVFGYGEFTKVGVKEATVNYYADEAKTTILGGSISGEDMETFKMSYDSFIEYGGTLSTYIESKTNYLILSVKAKEYEFEFTQKIDENCYTVEVYTTGKYAGITNGYHVHNTYKK